MRNGRKIRFLFSKIEEGTKKKHSFSSSVKFNIFFLSSFLDYKKRIPLHFLPRPETPSTFSFFILWSEFVNIDRIKSEKNVWRKGTARDFFLCSEILLCVICKKFIFIMCFFFFLLLNFNFHKNTIILFRIFGEVICEKWFKWLLTCTYTHTHTHVNSYLHSIRVYSCE